MVGEVAGHVHGQGLDATANVLGREAAQGFGQRQVRRDRPGGFRGQERRIDCVACGPSRKHIDDLFAGFLGDAELSLCRERAEVRREHGVRGLEERVVRGGRLGLEDVEGGARDLAVGQGLGYGRLVVHAAASDVDQHHAGLEIADVVGVDDAARRLVQRHVNGDDVGLLDDGFDVCQGHAVHGRQLGGHERVVTDDVHFHAAGPISDCLANLAQADDAEGTAAKLNARERAALPLPATHGGIGGGGLAGERMHQCDRLLRGRNGVTGRGVHHHHAGLGGGFEVYVVHADARSADDDEASGVGQDVGGDLDLAADEKGVVFADHACQLFGRQPDLLVNVVVGTEDFEALLREGLGNKDLHWCRAPYLTRLRDLSAATCAALTPSPGWTGRSSSISACSRTAMALRIAGTVT